MTDDYEILDPTKTNSKFDADADTAPPSTPIMSSIKQPVISNTNQLTAVGDNKKESQSIEQKDKTILGKKDVEVQLEQRKRNTKDDGKMIDKHFNDKKLLKKINKELSDKVNKC